MLTLLTEVRSLPRLTLPVLVQYNTALVFLPGVQGPVQALAVSSGTKHWPSLIDFFKWQARKIMQYC